MRKAILIVLLTSGCSIMGNSHPPDWPEHVTIVHKFDKVGDMVAQCEKWGIDATGYPVLKMIYACARFQFCTKPPNCQIAIPTEDALAKDWVYKHELKHCEGYDHVGSSSFRDAWERYKANPELYCATEPDEQ